MTPQQIKSLTAEQREQLATAQAKADRMEGEGFDTATIKQALSGYAAAVVQEVMKAKV